MEREKRGTKMLSREKTKIAEISAGKLIMNFKTVKSLTRSCSYYATGVASSEKILKREEFIGHQF